MSGDKRTGANEPPQENRSLAMAPGCLGVPERRRNGAAVARGAHFYRA